MERPTLITARVWNSNGTAGWCLVPCALQALCSQLLRYALPDQMPSACLFTVVDARGSVSGQVVRLNRVCLLRLAATSPRLSPGRYEARCRLKLLPDFSIDELNITASPAAGGGKSASRRYMRLQLQQLPAAPPAPTSADVGAAAATADAADWVEMAVGPVVLDQQGTLEVVVQSTSGVFKHGLLFDCFTVLQLPGPSQVPGRRHPPPTQQTDDLGLGVWSPASQRGALFHVPQCWSGAAIASWGA